MFVFGREERFPPTGLSAGYGLRKETIAGMRRNGRDAPRADEAQECRTALATLAGSGHLKNARRARCACSCPTSWHST